MELSFIVIDDSELDCFIARKIIEHTDESLTVQTFQSAQQALSAISDGSAANNSVITIVLLDLQMPLMNGFQFVEEFEKLPAGIQKKYKVVLLSSTRNTNDIFRILTYNTVSSLLEKPLTKEKLFTLLMQVKTD
jgi:CheY-like chemotaxis protein